MYGGVSPKRFASNRKSKRRLALTKAEFFKLQPGTFLEISWMDASNEVVLLLEKPSRERFCPWILTSKLEWRTLDSHEQVERVLHQIKFPKVL